MPPAFEPGVSLVYSGAPGWEAHAPGTVVAGRHDLELRVSLDSVRVESMTLLRNPTRERAIGKLWVEDLRLNPSGLEGLEAGWSLRPEVTVDREILTPLRSAVKISDDEVRSDSIPPLFRSVVYFELFCPPKGEEHVVVKYTVPFGRSLSRSHERIFAYDFGSMVDAKVAPKVFLRMPEGLRLSSVRPAGRVVQSSNGRILEIERLDLSQERVLILRFVRSAS
jgi:hypothetical protein